ncbi:hypothetical protein Poly21_07790 [Allorhodopirellula heiligendammensis]|uniref:Uncharacterized protein n=2 Tax=Allorhodopirellula heiligendammensis TaxID=2714739 RepID=A0A5C6C3F7_9BACT|nr:hypothetical protein Poly21_07790 [Allorhodopirellula heiligendammensis]
MNLNQIMLPFTMMIVTLSIAGCQESDDTRLVEMSERHELRQAEQTQQANQLHREFTAMQREVQAERTAIGQQRDLLEVDRRSVASERRFDSLTAAAVINIGLWLACLLPLVIAWLVLRQPQSSADDQAIIDVMLEDLVADKPRLLSQRPKASSNSPRIRVASSPDDEPT